MGRRVEKGKYEIKIGYDGKSIYETIPEHLLKEIKREFNTFYLLY